MVIGIFGESCTGKSTLADKIARSISCEVFTGKDYLRLAKNEGIAKALFRKKMEEAISGENILYVISEKEHLSLLPEGALRILVTAELEMIKSRFAERLRGNLPAPVAAMLEKKHGCFDAEPHDIHVVSGGTDLDTVVEMIKARLIDRSRCIRCVWEHNGDDTLLYAVDYPGAFARGASLSQAAEKIEVEIRSYCAWRGTSAPEGITVEIVQEAACDLQIRDADSDVLFDSEKEPLTQDEYHALKILALRSAEDFMALYESVLDKEQSTEPIRRTFYGQVPRSAEEMYRHTKNVNAYYFGEIGVEADNEGNILECRKRGFVLLEQQPGYLNNVVFEGSYGELWTLRKMLRRFLWHDRIHAKAMYRRCGGKKDPFCFGGQK